MTRMGALGDPVVVMARLPGEARYPGVQAGGGGAAYEAPNAVHAALEHLFREAGLGADMGETPGWNPLGAVIHPGDVVVLKPNWVLHENHSGRGMDCMVTHASVLAAVLEFVQRARPGRVIVGDAPIQLCDFDLLMKNAGYEAIRSRYKKAGTPVEWLDFRRTILDVSSPLWHRTTEAMPLDRYVLFDLGPKSLLEPISHGADRFRVTMYDPELMHRTHSLGKHQYLVARDVIEADVVINLPKLKTHKKAGLTGALKNIVGIIGNKEYLPHHRMGGARTHGDCYPGGSPFKLLAERLLDAANRRDGFSALLLRQAAQGSCGLARLTGADSNLEGNWYGNDTIWRTSLDLNRLLLYGRRDGTVADTPQRRLLSVTDAIICGEGEGPLAPIPHPLGVVTLAANPAAAERVHAHLMGFDWRKIPIVREAFARFDLPIAKFGPGEVELWFEGQRLSQPWPPLGGAPFVPPRGWQGHCERDSAGSDDQEWMKHARHS